MFVIRLDVKSAVRICIEICTSDDLDPADIVPAKVDQLVLCHEDVGFLLTHANIIVA